MKFIENLDEGLPFFKAMASNVRIEILKILAQYQDINLNDLAKMLGITNGALTSHIRLLEDVGVIEVKTVAAKHGTQKICSVKIENYVIKVGQNIEKNSYILEIAPGQYIDFEVTPTCGISTSNKIIGLYDTPSFFADLEHFQAQIVWFTTGFVEYEIPNYLPESSTLHELQIQAELGSEAKAYNNDYKSNIHFYINETLIGIWQSPGDFGGVKGLYNPDWWVLTMNQFGILVDIRVTETGTFIDDRQISDVTIGQLNIKPNSRVRLKLAVPHGLPDSRGLTIYGRGFGNYNNGMIVRLSYDIDSTEEE